MSEWYDKCIIHQDEDRVDALQGEFKKGWYFLDETWNQIGPYLTREEAVKAIEDYAAGL